LVDDARAVGVVLVSTTDWLTDLTLIAIERTQAQLTSKVTVSGLKQSGRVSARKVQTAAHCSAADATRKAASLAVAAAVAASPLVAVEEAFARDVQPYAGLTPCKTSKAFAKREKTEIKALEKRLKKYDADSAPALALKATIEKTKTRFTNYGEAGLLCGKDGLPHLIVDGNLEHLGEFAIPGLGFLYVAGWIGYAGRSYINENAKASKPTEGEIIIDVPKALGLMFQAGAWPLLAGRELKNGTLTVPESEITVSPR